MNEMIADKPQEAMTPRQAACRAYMMEQHGMDVPKWGESGDEKIESSWEKAAQAAISAHRAQQSQSRTFTDDHKRATEQIFACVWLYVTHGEPFHEKVLNILAERFPVHRAHDPVREKLAGALRECRDALESAMSFHHPRFDSIRMRDVMIEAVNALLLVQGPTGFRWDDNKPRAALASAGEKREEG